MGVLCCIDLGVRDAPYAHEQRYRMPFLFLSFFHPEGVLTQPPLSREVPVRV